MVDNKDLGFTASVPADASATEIVRLLDPQIRQLAAQAWDRHPNNPKNKKHGAEVAA